MTPTCAYRKTAAELITKRGPQTQERKRKRSATPGGAGGADPSNVGKVGYDKDGKKGKSILSPAERRRQMEERIAEKKRLKAKQAKGEL